MRKIIAAGTCLLLASTSFCQQTLTLAVVCPLPPIIDQASGMEWNGPDKIWIHNDGVDTNRLFEIDTLGNLVRTLTVTNAANVDWEELAKDSAGNFYIGDFGNNNHTRQDLKIYKIINPDSISGSTTTAEIISSSYPDQTAFPPPNPYKNFDMEAMFAMNNSLYLFSKNWTTPYTGYTKLYKLPDTAGTYVAQLIDSFYTGPGPNSQYSVTGADISPDGSRVILIANNKCWLFSGFTGEQFFSGSWQQINLSGGLTLKEGVAFFTNDSVYICDETGAPTSGNLYILSLVPVISGAGDMPEMRELRFSASPVPFSEKLTLHFSGAETGNAILALFHCTGTKMLEQAFLKSSAEVTVTVNTARLDKGAYFLAAWVNGGSIGAMKLIK